MQHPLPNCVYQTRVMNEKTLITMNFFRGCLTALLSLILIQPVGRAGTPVHDAPSEAAAIYLDNRMEPVKAKKDAMYYADKVENTEKGYHFKVYFLSGELKMDGWYADEEMTIPQGFFTYYYRSGQIESQGEYRDGAKYGIWQRYDRMGNPKPERIYAFIPMMRAIGVKK